MKLASWRSSLSELARISSAVPWILLLVALSGSLDLLLDAIARGNLDDAPHFINWLWIGCPTVRGGLLVGLALLIETFFIRTVRWSIRYAPFAVFGAFLSFTSTTWIDLHSVAMNPPPHPPGRPIADIFVSAAAFAIVGYRIVSYRRKKHLG